MPISVSGKPVMDAGVALAESKRTGLPYQAWYTKANSVSNPLGPAPGRAHLLMLKKHIDELQKNEFIEIKIEQDGKKVRFPKMVFLKATRVSRGHEKDKDSLYLVEFADRRIDALNFSGTIEKAFNIIKPSAPGIAELYEATKKEGASYSWVQILAELWDEMSVLGSYPSNATIGFGGAPGPHRFHGISAYEAITHTLRSHGSAIRYNHKRDAIEIINIGDTDDERKKTENDGKKKLIFDDFPIQSNRSRFPEKVSVIFARLDYNIGTEDEDLTFYDHLQLFPVHKVDIATEKSGALYGSRIQLWDASVASWSLGDSEDPANNSEIQSRAMSRAALWMRAQGDGGDMMHRRYSGVHDFVAGPKVKNVLWRNFGDGWITEVWNGPGMIIPERGGVPMWYPSENMAPPDIARIHAPVKRECFCKPDATLNAGGSATCSVYKLEGGDWVDTDIDISVKSSPVEGEVSAGSFLRAYWHWSKGEWMADQAGCT